MADDNAPHTARVQAATSLLRFGRDGVELDDLQESALRAAGRM